MEISAHLTERGKIDLPIVLRAQAGDQSAFNELLKKYRNPVKFLVQKMITNSEDIEDVVIDTFGKAFSNINNYAPDYAFSTWLFKIATNRCIDHIRKKRINTLSINNTFENEDGGYDGIDLDSGGLSPEEETIKEQKNKLMRQFVDKLKPNYKRLVEMRYFEELSYEEIADKLELPVGTVKAQLFRARDFLARHITKSNIQL
jgi:RNA polymerase sigma-70 factor (ECF subfamily)